MFTASARTLAWKRLYSSLEGFNELGLSQVLTDKLNHNGIVQPTEIQTKALPRVLEGRHVVINAETGSGKTLCFLLPIIQRQMIISNIAAEEGTDNDDSIKSPSPPVGLVLVPTPDLAHQVSLVYNEYSALDCTMLYGNRPLLLSPSVGLLVATPTSLVQFDLYKILKNVSIVCCDEADSLLAGGERRAAWLTLSTVKKMHQRKAKSSEEDKTPSPNRQLLFTAATLPTNTPKSVGRILSQWLPKNSLFINTEGRHRMVVSADIVFENVNDAVLPLMGGVKEAGMFEVKFKLLMEKFLMNKVGAKKTIIFCNTVDTCQNLLDTLGSSGCGHINMSSLNKGVPPDERVKLLKDFNEGDIDILICTDLASRGIDTVSAEQVIMFDFPVNAADFLHRAGRTARAGKNGQVVGFVMPSDEGLAMEIKNIIKEEDETSSSNDVSFNNIFSRNKMLRRRMKMKKVEDDILANAE